MTYAESIEFLYGLRMFGAKYGLENTHKLAALAGNPQNQLRFIHVAGTNGKGSTCAMLEGIYRAAGLRVGLFTSPHLVSFRERIQVNRHLIPEGDIVQLVPELQTWCKQFSAHEHPTFFEAVTVMALKFFAKQKCDLVIWETGLGGRLDATNIVTPLASVITNIAYDHQQWLGDTLEKIAAEKAGIIKPGVPALTATDEPTALAVIEGTARERNSPFTHIESNSTAPPYATSLTGAHQQRNVALALATVTALQNQIPVPTEALRRGLATVHWPGRLQLVERPGGRKILFDGAHNVASVEKLVAALRDQPPAGGAITLILGIFADKDWGAICTLLAPRAEKIILVAVGSERSAAPQELAPICRAANPQTEIVLCNSLADALAQTASAQFVVITGSLYLIGEAMELLQLTERPPRDEKSLNEWTTKSGAKTLRPERA